MRRYSLSLRLDTKLIEDARYYFEKSVQFGCNSATTLVNTEFQFYSAKEQLWKDAYTINIEGRYAIIVPLERKMPESDGNILITKDFCGAFHTEIITLVPDNQFIGETSALTGVIMEDNWVGNLLRKQPVAHKRGDNGGFASGIFVPEEPTSNFEEDSREPVHALSINEANNPIGNIKDYLKCYDNRPGNDHVYQVKLCVAQPEPGTRSPWEVSGSAGNPVSVGHTFLVLTEKTPAKTIIRNVGFYPAGPVWPYDPEEQGQLNNDVYHDYNISLTIAVTSSQFTQILGYISKGNDKGYKYNLNSNNCTTFALNALREANVLLPRTKGHWHHGSGLNPGDLGEDIRELRLSSNMTRSTVYHDHPNEGNCY